MTMKKDYINEILLFLLIAAPIYQDSPLSKYLGAAGYYLIMPISLVAYVLYIVISGKMPKSKYLKVLLNLGIWLIIISFTAIAIWLILGGSITILGENLIVKAFKVLLQYFSFPAYISLILIVGRKCKVSSIGKCTMLCLIIITIICLLEVQEMPYAFRELHFAGKFPYWRVRLLTLESSTTATLIYTYIGVSLFYCLEYKKKFLLPILIICSVSLIAFTESKTLIIAILISIILLFLANSKKINSKTVVVMFICILGLFLFNKFLMPRLSEKITTDINMYTSISTRIYTSIIGLIIGCVFWGGVGCSVYLGIYKEFLERGLYLLNLLPFKTNDTEIVSLINSTTDTAFAVKSGILHYNVYWGILGTLYLLRNFIGLANAAKKTNIKHKEILLVIFYTEIIMLLGNSFSFEFWFIYGLLIIISEKTENTEYGKNTVLSR